jgi:hypothetical protein
LAGKCGHGQIEEWKMEDVHKLHSLKKCCPKDDFPLSRIDKVVDSTAGCKMMALLDCFSDLSTSLVMIEDEEKMSFITPFGM